MDMNMINIKNQDCFQYLETIPANSVDCIITDPPYGILQYSNRKM